MNSKTKLLRAGIPVLLAWSLAWLIGISILAKVAIDLRAELREADIDTELTLYATAVYGLTWFDKDGQFHDEVLRLEPDIMGLPYDIWVVEPDASPAIHFSPEKPRFSPPDFKLLAKTVMGQLQAMFLEGKDANGLAYRLYAIPTFVDGENETEAKAMVVIVADPEPGKLAYQAFVRKIIWTVVFLGIAGLLVGVALSYWSLRPAFASLNQRERFIAATAHELRTPLAALRGINESALQGDEAPERALRRMNGILQSASHTVDDLLLFARLDAGATLERQAVRLDLLVEALLPEDDSIALEAEASVVNVDPRLVSVAVRNLLENARKYGGPTDRGISVVVEGAEVIVRDEGNGFSPELLKRRDRDFSLSPSQSGSGLGLAIVNLVARLHGGSLMLSNREPQGAEVRLDLRCG